MVFYSQILFVRRSNTSTFTATATLSRIVRACLYGNAIYFAPLLVRSLVISFFTCVFESVVNPLIATLKPQSTGPSYSNTLIGTLIGGLLHLVQRGGDWAGRTNFVLFNVAL